MMYNKKILLLIGIIFLSLIVSGCFEYEERIVLNKDGSGTLEVEYWALEDVNINSDSFNLPKKEKDIRQDVEKKYTSETVKLIDFHVKEKSSSRYVRFKVTFNNLLDLNQVPQFHKNHIQFNKSGKSFNYERTVFIKDNECDNEEEPDNIFESLIIGLVKEGLNNIKFRFELEMPYKIIETNADWTLGENRAIWKFRLSDVMFQKEVEMTTTTK